MSARPRLHVAPLAPDLSFGDLAADLAADYGLIPDPWQALVLEDWLSITASRWSSLSCGLAVPRQNGKNGIIEVRELFGMVGRGEKILHTAHEVKTARKAFKRLQHFFGRQVKDPAAKFPELNALVVELRNVNGQEAIFLANGGSVEIVARSKNSGRGFTADVLVMDEAQEMSDEDLEALMPTTSAAPLGNPQWIFTGTPPGPKANGEVFTRTRTNALGENPGRVCWHEWSACDPGKLDTVDLDDPDVWHATNPSLGAQRPGELQLEVIEGERAQFSVEGFARERLGVWEDPASAGDSVIPLASWLACSDAASQIAGPLVFALDVAPDGGSAAIAVAGSRADGLPHVEVIAHQARTGWVVARAVELASKWGGEIALDPAGPAGSLLQDLKDAGLQPVEVSTREHVQACGDLFNAAVEGRMRHLSQPELNAALAGAARRSVGDAWLWARKSSQVDISPLVAVTLAFCRVGQGRSIYEDRGMVAL